MFVVGMFLRRPGQISVVIAAWLGLAMAISLAWWVELNWLLGLTDYATMAEATSNLAGPSPFLITPIASTFTFLMAMLLSFVFPNSRAKDTEALLWRAVVNRQEHP
jgi:hypothetical protein